MSLAFSKKVYLAKLVETKINATMLVGILNQLVLTQSLTHSLTHCHSQECNEISY